ncbi:MAG TPA: sulfur carrier protein ThiS [Actinomycetota bacterium]|nr:sulfur carrier protein ThiS [Actinomycetota bacterium]
MTRLWINGSAVELDDDAHVSDIVGRFTVSPRGTAVAVNGEVVPRSRWSDVSVKDGDRVEVLGAIGGG